MQTESERYGPARRQVVSISRPVSGGSGKAVILLHGGGWRAGQPAMLRVEQREWARAGWVVFNAGYRLGTVNGRPGDGLATLADAGAVLDLARAKSYVDPARIVVYGESAGGHLATWLAASRSEQVAATVAVSPVISVAAAIRAAREPTADPRVRSLGIAAQEFFGSAVKTSDALGYLDRTGSRGGDLLMVFSTDDWVEPDLHVRPLCSRLAARCHPWEFPGSAHAGNLIREYPWLVTETRLWAEAEVRAAS